MAIIGWFAMVVVLAIASLAWAVFAFNHMGTYTIGGAVNSFGVRLASILSGAFIAWLWWLLVTYAPFSIIIV